MDGQTEKSGYFVTSDRLLHPATVAVIDPEVLAREVRKITGGFSPEQQQSLFASAATYDRDNPHIPSAEWMDLIGKFRQSLMHISDACNMKENGVSEDAAHRITNNIADILYMEVWSELTEKATRHVSDATVWQHDKAPLNFLPSPEAPDASSSLLSMAKSFYTRPGMDSSRTAGEFLQTGGRIWDKKAPTGYREPTAVAGDFFESTLPHNVYSLLRGDSPPLQEARVEFTALIGGKYPYRLPNSDFSFRSEWDTRISPGGYYGDNEHGPQEAVEEFLDISKLRYGGLPNGPEKGEPPIILQVGKLAFKELENRRQVRENPTLDL